MKENNSHLKISVWPFLFVFVLLFLSVLGGSRWNKIRIEKKLLKIEATIERIYTARKEEIIATVMSDNSASQSALLNQINAPEKGINVLNFLLLKGGQYRFISQYFGNRNLNVGEIENLEKILNEDKSVSTDEDLFLRARWEDEKLYAFTPIKDKNGSLIGYLMLSVGKKQNL